MPKIALISKYHAVFAPSDQFIFENKAKAYIFACPKHGKNFNLIEVTNVAF
jgi:hypothetical protein